MRNQKEQIEKLANSTFDLVDVFVGGEGSQKLAKSLHHCLKHLFNLVTEYTQDNVLTTEEVEEFDNIINDIDFALNELDCNYNVNEYTINK